MSTVAAEGEDLLTPSSPAGRNTGRPRPLPHALLPAAGATLLAAAGALVAVGCFLGLYIRPTSDDWCAAWKTRDLGVLGITADFYTTQNGRVANAFLSGLLYSGGPAGTKLLPTLIAVSLTAALVLLGRRLLHALGHAPPLLLLTACALALQALLYYAGTRSYQVLLWAPATISHTLPSVIGLWALLMALTTVNHPHRAVRAAGLAGALLTGFALGTLSEPFALVSGLLAALTAVLCLPRLRLAPTWRPLTWCLVWCTGLACGLAVLYTSPGARWRRAQQPEKPPMLSPAELRATYEDWLRMWDTVTGQRAYLAAATAGLLLGLAATLRTRRTRTRTRTRARPEPEPQPRTEPGPGTATGPGRATRAALLLLPLPVVVLGSFAVAAGLRSGYGPTGWTYARTWTSFLLPMELALCGYGVLLGAWAGPRLAARGPAGPAAATLAALCLTVASMASLVPALQQLTTTTVARSVAWDAQNARIRAETARGATDVGYRPLPIGNLAEPFFTSDHRRDWVAACVSRWYDINRIHRR
ncbi:NDUFA4 family protein [Streptomyces erythrochromogenes]|nr:NDUFA4 family protein [Streptomyces erythrochromogenes]